MYILLVEDDPTWAETLGDELTKHYQAKKCRVERIATEKAFIARSDDLKKSPPDLILMDVMLRYQDPEEGNEFTEDWYAEYKRSGGRFKAGVRCAKLTEGMGIKSPVLLYTVLDEETLQDDLSGLSHHLYLRKDANLHSLYEKIGQIIATRS